MLRFRFAILVLFVSAVVGAQSGWSVQAQMARLKREDDSFYRHLPRDPKKKDAAVAAYLRLPTQERILDGWSTSYESKAVPKAFRLKPNVNLAGKWQRTRGPLGAAFGITRAPGGYAVNFYTWDPKGSTVFHRSGVLHGAVMVLNRPVFDLVQQPFQKVYVVAVGKEVRLLPSADVEMLDSWAKDPKKRARAIAGLTFRRG